MRISRKYVATGLVVLGVVGVTSYRRYEKDRRIERDVAVVKERLELINYEWTQAQEIAKGKDEKLSFGELETLLKEVGIENIPAINNSSKIRCEAECKSDEPFCNLSVFVKNPRNKFRGVLGFLSMLKNCFFFLTN